MELLGRAVTMRLLSSYHSTGSHKDRESSSVIHRLAVQIELVDTIEGDEREQASTVTGDLVVDG